MARNQPYRKARRHTRKGGKPRDLSRIFKPEWQREKDGKVVIKRHRGDLLGTVERGGGG